MKKNISKKDTYLSYLQHNDDMTHRKVGNLGGLPFGNTLSMPNENCCTCKDQLDQIITLLKEIKVKI